MTDVMTIDIHLKYYSFQAKCQSGRSDFTIEPQVTNTWAGVSGSHRLDESTQCAGGHSVAKKSQTVTQANRHNPSDQ